MAESFAVPRKGFWSFVNRDDPVYRHYEQSCAPRSALERWIYVALYLLPGSVAYVLINIPLVFQAGVALTGLSPKNYQYALLILITYLWHMLLPFLILRRSDGLSVRQSLAYLGLDRVDLKTMFFWMPLSFLGFVLVSFVYMPYVYGPLRQWTEMVPALRIPPYSMFQEGPDSLFTFPPVMLLFLFIGNFIGEELYYRGYLFKKTAFLGGWNWLANSLLFCFYHFWQAPQTWPLVGLVLVFGALMQLRKDLWSMVVLHLLINVAWAPLGMWIQGLFR